MNRIILVLNQVLNHVHKLREIHSLIGERLWRIHLRPSKQNTVTNKETTTQENTLHGTISEITINYDLRAKQKG